MPTLGTINRVQRGHAACICLPWWILNAYVTKTDYSKKDVWRSAYTGDVLIKEIPVFF